MAGESGKTSLFAAEVASGRPRARAGTAADTAPEVIGSRALFGARREILIRHEGTIYRLRITSKDKLILTK